MALLVVVRLLVPPYLQDEGFIMYHARIETFHARSAINVRVRKVVPGVRNDLSRNKDLSYKNWKQFDALSLSLFRQIRELYRVNEVNTRWDWNYVDGLILVFELSFQKTIFFPGIISDLEEIMGYLQYVIIHHAEALESLPKKYIIDAAA